MEKIKTVAYGIEIEQELMGQLEKMAKRSLRITNGGKVVLKIVDGNIEGLREDIEMAIELVNEELEDVLELTLLENEIENEAKILVENREELNPLPGGEGESPKLKVFEAFAGIGAQHQALKNIGANFEIVGISEIDKFAIASYNAIHGEVSNYGDISKLDEKEISNIQMDIFTYSFPCQDISLVGHQKGLDRGSNTRSSLLWECEKVIKTSHPKVLLMENVKNLVGKKNKPNFDRWLDLLEEYGYTNYWEVLNAKDYGVPQNRERVFVVSILGDHKPYTFPKRKELSKKLKEIANCNNEKKLGDILEKKVDEKYYLSEERIKQIEFNFEKNKTKAGIIQVGKLRNQKRENPERYRVFSEKSTSPSLTTMQGGGLQPCVVCEERKDEEVRFFKDDVCGTIRTIDSGGDKRGYSHTITTSDNIGVLDGYRVRKLTPLECWRLMGFGDDEFYKAEKVNSNSQLYKQAGNSIVVDVLEGIFTEIIKSIEK